MASPPALTALSNDSICTGGSAVFSTTASGGIGNATGYVWQYNNGGTWAAVSNGVPANVTYSVTSSG